jgi:hypothetical protein
MENGQRLKIRSKRMLAECTDCVNDKKVCGQEKLCDPALEDLLEKLRYPNGVRV